MMPKTQLEKNISHKRQRNGILVPILEDRLKWPVRIETQADVNFIADMLRKNIERERRREEEENVFSPSALAECLRKVYLTKNSKKLDVPRVYTPKMDTNFFFELGEWTHLRLTYRLWKAAQEFPEIDVLAIEQPVKSKRKDHGGTIDVVVRVNDEIFIVDWKGVNLNDFGKFVRGDPPLRYSMQTVDYLWLARLDRDFPWPVERALLIAESKGGPDTRHPIALHETILDLEDHLPELKARVKLLRGYEAEKEVPPPECETTRGFQFRGCPFSSYCKAEVKAVEKLRNGHEEKELRVATPQGRGNSHNRKKSLLGKKQKRS